MIELIVATAANGVIGSENRMLWHIPEDFAHFKKTTMGHPVIMGRKTWESIGRPLPGRDNIVITRNSNYQAPGATVAKSLQDALALFDTKKTVFVIGGGEIYRQALPLAHKAWVTVVNQHFDGDTTFPVLDTTEWVRETLHTLPATQQRPYSVDFFVYTRR